MSIFLSLVAFSLVLHVLCTLNAFLVLAEVQKRYGLIHTPDEAVKAAYELLQSHHWTMELYQWLYPMAFFYYVLPVVLYQRFVKHSMRSTLLDPRGKWGR